MGLTRDQSITAYGTEAYTGWGEAEAAADAREHPEKIGNVGGAPMFDFDFVGEATRAYGELGAYYDRVLKESQGDTNTALSRLTDDYQRGKRIRTEDLTTAQNVNTTNQQKAFDQAQNTAAQRGLLSKSYYDTSGGMGLGQQVLTDATQPYDLNKQNLLTTFNRQNEEADIAKTRTETDTLETQKRKEFDLEQQRRKEAAEMAEQRGNRAYQKFSAQLT
jgi:hypothetical protein